MIIKNRQFKVEKMGDFLAQNSISPHIPVKPMVSRTPANEFKQNDSQFLHHQILDEKPLVTRPKNKGKTLVPEYKRGPLSKTPLPEIHERPEIDKLPPIRNVDKSSRASKVINISKSTPKMENRMDYKPEISISKQMAQKLEAFQQKTMEIAAAEEIKKKMIDTAQIKAFNDKYEVEFAEGYHKNALMRCVELLNIENDPGVLASIVPDKYVDYMNKSEEFKPSMLPSINEFGRKNTSKSNLLGGYSPLLPNILNKQIGTKGFSVNKIRDYSSERGDMDVPDNYTVTSSMSVNYKSLIPKIDLQTFEHSLDYFKESEQDGIFMVVRAKNKGVTSEFGFCETIFNEKRKDAACITKYFVARAYRKLKMVLPITLKLVDYLFKTLKLEKLSIKLYAENNFAQNDLRIVGFKLEKIEFEQGRKVKIYSLKKIFFKELMESLSGNKVA